MNVIVLAAAIMLVFLCVRRGGDVDGNIGMSGGISVGRCDSSGSYMSYSSSSSSSSCNSSHRMSMFSTIIMCSL